MRLLGGEELAVVAEQLGSGLDVAGIEPAPPSTHAVFRARLDDGSEVAIKVFRSWARGEPDREWLLLTALDGTGLAPAPVWRSPAGNSPVIVSTWLYGESLGGSLVGRATVRNVGAAHAALHVTPPPLDAPPALTAAALTSQRILQFWQELPRQAAELGLSAAVRARVEQPPIAASAAVARLIADSPKVLCRGDPNLANYLRDDGAIRLIDFEDAGVAEVANDVAEMIEHFANRTITDWGPFLDNFDVPADDVVTARGLVAEFWFGIIIRRMARGLSMSPPTTAEEQLARIQSLGVL